MLLFIIFGIAFVLCFLLMILKGKLSHKFWRLYNHYYHRIEGSWEFNDNHEKVTIPALPNVKKKSDLYEKLSDIFDSTTLEIISTMGSVIFGIILIIMLIMALVINNPIALDECTMHKQNTYEVLVNQAKAGNPYITNDIIEWNTSYDRVTKYDNDPWIGIFYNATPLEGLERIEL